MNEINIDDKTLQKIGMTMIEAAPTAKYIEVRVFDSMVEIYASDLNYHIRTYKVPLLKEVD